MTMESDKAAEMVRGRHRLVVKGIQLACEFLGPIIRATTNDPRALVAVTALETACAIRARRARRRTRA